MFILIQSVFRLVFSLLPFVEIIFLSYVLGYSFGSFPLSLVIFLFLLLATFLHSGIAKSVAWGMLGFVLFSVNMKAGFFAGFLFALFFGVLRYVVHKIRRRWKSS